MDNVVEFYFDEAAYGYEANYYNINAFLRLNFRKSDLYPRIYISNNALIEAKAANGHWVIDYIASQTSHDERVTCLWRADIDRQNPSSTHVECFTENDGLKADDYRQINGRPISRTLLFVRFLNFITLPFEYDTCSDVLCHDIVGCMPTMQA